MNTVRVHDRARTVPIEAYKLVTGDKVRQLISRNAIHVRPTMAATPAPHLGAEHLFSSGEDSLPQYRAHFLNYRGHVWHTVDFNAEHDDHAKEHARREFKSGIGMGYEIWTGDRHVHTERYR